MTLYYANDLDELADGDGTTNSGFQPQNFCYGQPITLPAGTVVSLGVLAVDNGVPAGIAIKLGLYDSGGNLIIQTTATIPAGSSGEWVDSGAISQAIAGGTYYVLMSGATDQAGWVFITSVTDGVYASVAYASAMASSVTIESEGSRAFGVRADVVEAAAVPPFTSISITG